MAQKKNNRKAAAGKKKQILQKLSQPLETKSNVQNSLIETGKDLIIGVVGGGFAGAAIGKPSLIVGVLTTGVGHYMNNKLLSSFGMGMMASNGFQNKSVSGLTGLEGAKERMEAYKVSFMEKTYVDKVKALTQGKTKTVSGVGEVQYFSYPQNLEGSADEYNFLNKLDEHLINQGANQANVSGLEGEFSFQEAIY